MYEASPESRDAVFLGEIESPDEIREGRTCRSGERSRSCSVSFSKGLRTRVFRADATCHRLSRLDAALLVHFNVKAIRD